MDPKDPNNVGLKAKDSNGSKADVGKKPGKVANTDHYGNGGAGGETKVPGKKSGTENLPEGRNGKESKAAENEAAGKTRPPANLTPLALPVAKDQPVKELKKPAGKTAKKGDLGATKGKKGGEGNHVNAVAPTHDALAPVALTPLPSEPAKVIDTPTVAPIDTVVVAPPANGKAHPLHDALRAEVGSLSELIKAAHTEILSMSKQLEKSVAAQLQSYAASIDQRVQAGTQRVGTAYSGLSTAINTAVASANAEVTKREQSIPAKIKQVRDAKSEEIKASIAKVKVDTRAAIVNGPEAKAAEKTGIAFADKMKLLGKSLTDEIKQKTSEGGELSQGLNPKRYSDQIQFGGEGTRPIGHQALVEDKRLGLITSAGKKAIALIEGTIKATSEEWRKDSAKKLNEALTIKGDELDKTINEVHQPQIQKHLDTAATLATQTLNKQVADSRTGIAKVQKDATTKIGKERHSAEDGAKKAGKALSDNIKHGAKEIESRIAATGAKNAASYNKLNGELKKLGKGKKLDAATKAKLDAMKADLGAAHEQNKTTLEQIATTSVDELKREKEKQYEDAIAGYETAAAKTKQDFVGKVTTATTALATSFDTIGTGFDATVKTETENLKVEFDFYTEQSKAIPQTMQTMLDKLVTGTETGLRTATGEMIKADTVQAKLNKESEPLVTAAMKTGQDNAHAIWDAMDGAGTDENKIFGAMRTATPGEIVYIEAIYNAAYPKRGTKKYPSPLQADLDDELSGSEWDIAFAYLRHQREKAIKLELDDSRGIFNDEEDRIEEVLKAASDDELKNILDSADGQATLNRVKGCLSGCDLDVVNALTTIDKETGMPAADRKVKADAIRIYDAMYGGTGIGTDEAKIKQILEATTDPKQRKALHDAYNAYIRQKDPLQAHILEEQSGKGADLMDASFDDEMSGGEWTETRAMSESDLTQEDHLKLVKMAKVVDGAHGAGTDEDKIVDNIETDEEYFKKYKAEKDPLERKKMAEGREKAMNARLRWLEGERVDEKGEKLKGPDGKELQKGPNVMTSRFQGESITDIIKGEMGSEDITFEELDLRKWGPYPDRGAKNGSAVEPAIYQQRARLGQLNLEYMVAQRKLQAGNVDPELLIAYSCWGVAGTDETNLKKGLKKGGELYSKQEIQDLRNRFKHCWGVDMMNGTNELERRDFKQPTGTVPSEVDGKDWLEIRISLMGKPETPQEIAYVDNVRYKFVTTGTGSPSPWSHAREDMEVNHKRIQDECDKAIKENKPLNSFDAADKSKKPVRSNFAADETGEAAFKKAEEEFYSSDAATAGTYMEENRLEILSGYAEKSEMAFLTAKEAMADAIITVIELIGAALITAVSMGASSPMLAMFIGNLILSGMTIIMRKEMIGDAYGSEAIGIDVVKGIVMAGIQAAGEAKVVADFASKAGKMGGKAFQIFSGGAEKAGMKVVGKEGLEIAEKAALKLEAKVGSKIASEGAEKVATKEATTVAEKAATKEVTNVAEKTATKEATNVAEKTAAKEGTDVAEKAATKEATNVAENAAAKETTEAVAKKTGKEQVESAVESGTKNAVNSAMSESAQFLMDEKTWEMKGFDAVFGENSLGAKLLKKLPSAFAQGAVSDYIQNLAHVSSPDKVRGPTTGSEAAFRNVLAEVGGNTAGFLTYLDNYSDASTFWQELFKSNVQSIGSGYLSGYLNHKQRAVKLGVDAHKAFTGTDQEAIASMRAQLHEADGYMEPHEKQRLVDRILKEKGGADVIQHLPESFQKLAGKAQQAGGDVTGDGGEQKSNKGKTATEEKNEAAAKKQAAADEAQKKKPEDEEIKKKATGEENKDEAAAKKVADDAKKNLGDPETKKPVDSETKKPQTRDERIADQKEQGHAGIEVHSHFMGNVDPSQMRNVIEESGLAPMKKGDPNGKTASEKIGHVSGHEAMLDEITKLSALSKPGDQPFEHIYQTKPDGTPELDENGRPKIKTRGKTGDAIEQAQAAQNRIAALKEKLLDPNLSDADAQKIRTQIKNEARSAVEKALRASDETDFNSAYEVRDELVKKFYGEADRKKALEAAGIKGDASDSAQMAAYRKHFEAQGRPEVVARIDAAENARAVLANPEMVANLEKTPEGKAELKKHRAALEAGAKIPEQFAYDRYAKDTVLRLVQDGLTYTEQSNSAKKLAERFDPQQIDMIKRQLAAEHPDLKDKIEQFEIRHVAMLNTAQFGVRGNIDSAGNSTIDNSDIHEKAQGTRKGFADKEAEEKAFKGAVGDIVKQQKRGDVVGVDIAGAEHFTFDDKGAQRFAFLYDELRKAAIERKEPIVLRPHVGEGANDPESGKSFHRDADRQMVNGEISGRARAKDNLDALLITLDDIAQKHGQGGKLPPEVIVRFGHATALTPDQAVMMAKLGIIAEVNLSSNIETGASSQRDPASKTKDRPRPEGQAPFKDNDPRRGGRLDDHSLATMIMNDVPIILSTDGHSVMSTNMKREYDLANQQIDRILKSRQAIPMTMEQAKQLGVKNLKPDDRGNVMVKLKDIPANKQGEIIKKFSDARAKFYDDANNYYDKRPKQGPKEGEDDGGTPKIKGDDDGSVSKTKMGAIEEGATANSETPNFEVEKHNTDDHRERAKTALGRLSAVEQQQVQAMMDNAPTHVQKNMLERAVAAGRSAAELEQLRVYMSSLGGDDAVARALSGAGVIQFYAHSCVPSAYQTAIADVDPYYAFQLRMNPELIMDQQRFVLALNGTQQKQRADVENEQAFRDANALTPNLQEHLDDKSMGNKLRDQKSYGPGTSNDQGLEPTALKGSDLHAQLEKATGRKYEVLANASLPFKKQGDGHFPDGQAPHDRIMAAVDLHLPVIIGQQFATGQLDHNGQPITQGHAVVIVAYQKIGMPPNEIIRYTTRDPATGKTDVLLDSQMDSLGTGTVTVPNLGPTKKTTTAGDESSSSVKKPVADGDEKSTKIGSVEEKNAKPEPETFADAHDRRSQGVKPKNPEHESTFASPNDRKGVAKEVPLSRQELRELLVAKYGEFLKPWLEAKHTAHEDWLPLIKELQQIETGAGGKDKTLGPKYEEKFRELSAKIAEKEAANGKKKELDDIQLRSFYNLVEKEEMRSTWHPELKNLPPEQVAKLMSMYREELKLFVRDLMQDDNATEVLYQRDRIVYGDRKGPQFDDLVNKKVAKDTSADTLEGKEGKAYKDIVDSSMRSNEEMNLKLTGYKDGIDPEVGKKIRETAQDPTKTLPEIQKANAQQAEADKAKTKTGGLDQTTAIAKAKNETEQADTDKIQASTDIIKDKLGLDTPKFVPPPDGKPVLKQSPSDALISLPIDVISPTASGADAIKKFQDDGIPRWGALSEKERMHETKFANAVEAKLPAFVDEFLAMSKSGETYKFEVDGAKKLYGAYGKAMDVKDTANGGITADQMEVRATANHALHPTAVAIARLAFLKHIDTMQPGEQIFVTNGGCASGKGSLFGVAEAQMGKNQFGAVWDAAGEGDAQENMWILKAAQARGLKVTYGFVDNNPSAKYEGVLDRAMSTGRIVDPTTFARSYARGLDNMVEFMNSPEYKDMVAKGQVQTFGVDGAVYKKDDPSAGGLMGEKKDGRITAADLEKVQATNKEAGRTEVKITDDATKIFEAWLKKKQDDPNARTDLWREGGGANALKFGQNDTKTGGGSSGVAGDDTPTKLVNTPLVTGRAKTALDAMDESTRSTVDAELKATKNDAERALLERAIAAGRSVEDIHKLRLAVSDEPAETLLTMFSGEGLLQHYQHSCVPTAYQIALANLDPVYAMELRNNPSMMQQQQQSALESLGSTQQPRNDIRTGKDINGGTGGALKGEVKKAADDPEMGGLLRNPASKPIAGGGTNGVDPPAMKDQPLHKKLEQLTGHTYESLTTDRGAFGAMASDDKWAGKATPSDRIVAAAQAGLPVLMSMMNHEYTITGVTMQDGKALLHVSDPMHGATSLWPIELLSMMDVQTLIVPKMEVAPGASVVASGKPQP